MGIAIKLDPVTQSSVARQTQPDFRRSGDSLNYHYLIQTNIRRNISSTHHKIIAEINHLVGNVLVEGPTRKNERCHRHHRRYKVQNGYSADKFAEHA
jgi:hypothetical protein